MILFLMTCDQSNKKPRKNEETCISGFITELNDSYHSMKIEGKLIDCEDLNK